MILYRPDFVLLINLFIFLYMEKTSVFTTPLPLVYAKEKKMEFVSALDLSKLDTLIGIKLDKITLSLKQSKVSWYDAYWIVERNKTLWKTPCLPEEDDCQELVLTPICLIITVSIGCIRSFLMLSLMLFYLRSGLTPCVTNLMLLLVTPVLFGITKFLCL